MTVLTALSLGIMISFVKIDYVLRWLIPCCFGLLIFAVICILVTLGVAGSNSRQELNELLYSSTLVSEALGNG